MQESQTAVRALNELLLVIVDNTLKENDGKRGNRLEEKKKVRNVLVYMLNREPNKEEVALAITPFWPKDLK